MTLVDGAAPAGTATRPAGVGTGRGARAAVARKAGQDEGERGEPPHGVLPATADGTALR